MKHTLESDKGGDRTQMKEQSSIDKTKGTIECPICGKKEVVGENTSGKASHWCNCGHLIESDYDKLTAKEIRPKKGATRQAVSIG